jgi:hypothetical protein
MLRSLVALVSGFTIPQCSLGFVLIYSETHWPTSSPAIVLLETLDCTRGESRFVVCAAPLTPEPAIDILGSLPPDKFASPYKLGRPRGRPFGLQ